MTQCITLFDEKIYLSHVFIRGTRLKEFIKNNITIQSILEKRFSFDKKDEFMKRIIKHVVIVTFRLLNEYYLYSEKSFERELSLNDLFLHIPKHLGVQIIPRKTLYMNYFFLIMYLLQVEKRYLYEEEDFIYNCNKVLQCIKDAQKGGYIGVAVNKVEFDSTIRRLTNILNLKNVIHLPTILQRNIKIVFQIRNNLPKGIFSKLRFI